MGFVRGSGQSNLDRFLQCTTPLVQPQFLPKSEVRNLNRLWHPWERDTVEYFTLGDLWNCYDEWSAYGAGVPIFNNTEALVQYYVPCLSAIQIFTGNSCLNGFREGSESGDSETKDLCSDLCSNESESDKLWRWDGCSSDEGGLEQDNLWQLNDRLGNLYFQYFEMSTPYARVPLMDKMNELARKYPGLMSLRSVDLSPASWMAVAWYPIYHIPMARTIKDLSTCFLSYHTLSSSFQGTLFFSANGEIVWLNQSILIAYSCNAFLDAIFSYLDMDLEDDIESPERKRKVGEGISLAPFALATYKMQGNVWVTGNCGQDQERLMSLLSVADSWLKQLKVQHHDFNYFNGVFRRG